MPAYDTSLDPVGEVPNNTTEHELVAAVATGNESWFLTVSNLGSAAVKVRLGITPASGSPTLWILYEDEVQPGDPMTANGPHPVKAGCKLIIRTDVANVMQFIRMGYIDSP